MRKIFVQCVFLIICIQLVAVTVLFMVMEQFTQRHVEDMNKSLAQYAGLAVKSIDPRDIESLTGANDAQRNSPAYKNLYKSLSALDGGSSLEMQWIIQYDNISYCIFKPDNNEGMTLLLSSGAAAQADSERLLNGVRQKLPVQIMDDAENKTYHYAANIFSDEGEVAGTLVISCDYSGIDRLNGEILAIVFAFVGVSVLLLLMAYLSVSSLLSGIDTVSIQTHR